MTKFEQVANILNNSDAPDLRENCIYWLDGDKVATVNFVSRSRYASKVRKLREKFPDDVKIFSDRKDGSLIAAVSVKMVKINLKQMNLTDERKEELRERISAIRKGVSN